MTKIKIISNPYEQTIKYAKFDNSINDFIDINKNNNQNSKLIGQDFTNCFFPFKAKDIVEEIKNNFASKDDILELEFEGTEDEFEELKKVIEYEETFKNNINLTKSSIELSNAREVLDDIIYIFKDVEKLVYTFAPDNEDINKNIKKFSEASNNVLPICVVGNVSVGKSTFINALIGREILPSGDDPVTAKIYKIIDSKQEDIAVIRFKYNEERISARFQNNSLKFSCSETDCELVENIKENFENIKNCKIDEQIKKILDFLNTYGKESKQSISPLIEIEICFNSDIIQKLKNPVVIFDTPGSNSATNKGHFDILKKQLKDLSNGLPVYISTSSSLDSTDNEFLINKIKSIKELDNRFTMIVINKVDEANLKTSSIDNLKDKSTVIRELYSQGIFFTSSLMGLGSKINGDFVEEYAAEKFEILKNIYTDKNNKFYKQLYKFNVLPFQLKQKLESCITDKINPIYVNSGLFVIEKEIETYANKYSPYNKCQQAKLFLNKIFDLATDKIESLKFSIERENKRMKNTFSKNKIQLINEFQDKLKDCKDKKILKYGNEIKEYVDNNKDFIINEEEIKDSEKKFKKQKSIEANIDQAIKISNEANQKALENIKSFNLKELGKDMFSAYNKWQEYKKIQEKVDKATYTDLIEHEKINFVNGLEKFQQDIDVFSQNIWSKNTEDIRKILIGFITESESLNDEQKDKLTNIIMTFYKISFDAKPNDIFKDEDFKKLFSNNADTYKLMQIYNKYMKAKCLEFSKHIKEYHENVFEKWSEKLKNKIIENIDDLNPSLKQLLKNIGEKEEKIEDIEKKREQLHKYMNQVSNMISWK